MNTGTAVPTATPGMPQLFTSGMLSNRFATAPIKHLSLALDLSIVFDTVKVIVFGKGAK